MPKCFGSRRRIANCKKEARFPVGSGLSAKPCCGNDDCKDAIIAYALEKARKSIKTERAQKTKVDKERIKSLSTICSEAQKDVNAMIRALDMYHGYKCIASGQDISDCGHFYHAGSKYRISWLRFHHANLHGQGAKSNRYAGGGDALNYVEGLKSRYGTKYIEELKDFKRCEDLGLWPKPTKEEVRAMATWCRAMTRLYLKMQK